MVNEEDANKIQCTELKDALNGRERVDLWSLDVEGHEISILKAVNFTEVQVEVLLVEDFWLPHDDLDKTLLNAQMFKAAQFPIDAVYVNRDIIGILPDTFWFPPEWTGYQKLNEEYRLKMISENKLQI